MPTETAAHLTTQEKERDLGTGAATTAHLEDKSETRLLVEDLELPEIREQANAMSCD